MKRLCYLLTFILSVVSLRAATYNAASASAADIQDAITNHVSNGDTVVVPAGSATWNSTGITSSKGITLDLTAGVTITRGTGTTTLIDVTTDATYPFQLKGGTFNQTTASLQFRIGGGFSNAKFRVINSTFYTTASAATLIEVNQSWGVIDTCTITADGNSEMIHNLAWGTAGPGNTTSNPGWDETITPGSSDALYIDTCTFTKVTQTGGMGGCSGIQAYYGARTVARYCTFNYCQIDQHGTGGAVGVRWYEFYNNHFVFPVNSDGKLMDLRAGSGVVFNTTLTLGAGSQNPGITLSEEDTGSYPELWQVGRGKDSTFPPTTGADQALDPLYAWANDVTPDVKAGSATYIQVNRDYYTSASTTRPGYTPYTYPYPWGAPSTAGSSVSGQVTASGNVKFN